MRRHEACSNLSCKNEFEENLLWRETLSKSGSDKKNTSLRLDSKTLKALKIQAIEDDTSVQAILELLIVEYLKGNIHLKKLKK